MKNKYFTTSLKIAAVSLSVFALCFFFTVHGNAATVPNSFSPGTTISSSEMNENFSYMAGHLSRSGNQVGSGLYEVHTRVLWDVGWLLNDAQLVGGYFSYTDTPRNLMYAGGREVFLSPLKGYGIPEVQVGATRKVRLYVYYGEQLDFNGVPTVTISGGGNSVDFVLPKIGGHYADQACNWSNFVTYAEYQLIGHANISMNYANCTNCWEDRPYGVVYRIEAHYYDEFPE